MVFKPMQPSDFKRYLNNVGWYLEKGGIDWSVFDDKGKFVCSIRISHGTTKSEVPAFDIHKVKKHFIKRGMQWPPQKKLKKN